jgi:hypothetical protein
MLVLEKKVSTNSGSYLLYSVRSAHKYMSTCQAKELADFFFWICMNYIVYYSISVTELYRSIDPNSLKLYSMCT